MSSEYKRFKALMKEMDVGVSEHEKNDHIELSIDSGCLEPYFVFDEQGRFIGFYDAGYGTFHLREEE